jgi:hypothetical protein
VVDKLSRSVEHWWNDFDRGKRKYSKKNLSECNCVHHKSHVERPRSERGPPWWATDKYLTAWSMAWPAVAVIMLEYFYFVMAHAQTAVFVFQLNGQVHVFWRVWPLILAARLCMSANNVCASTEEAFFRVSVEVTECLIHYAIFPSIPLCHVAVCYHPVILL